jgi:hypothetical protein
MAAQSGIDAFRTGILALLDLEHVVMTQAAAGCYWPKNAGAGRQRLLDDLRGEKRMTALREMVALGESRIDATAILDQTIKACREFQSWNRPITERVRQHMEAVANELATRGRQAPPPVEFTPDEMEDHLQRYQMLKGALAGPLDQLAEIAALTPQAKADAPRGTTATEDLREREKEAGRKSKKKAKWSVEEANQAMIEAVKHESDRVAYSVRNWQRFLTDEGKRQGKGKVSISTVSETPFYQECAQARAKAKLERSTGNRGKRKPRHYSKYSES